MVQQIGLPPRNHRSRDARRVLVDRHTCLWVKAVPTSNGFRMSAGHWKFLTSNHALLIDWGIGHLVTIYASIMMPESINLFVRIFNFYTAVESIWRQFASCRWYLSILAQSRTLGGFHFKSFDVYKENMQYREDPISKLFAPWFYDCLNSQLLGPDRLVPSYPYDVLSCFKSDMHLTLDGRW